MSLLTGLLTGLMAGALTWQATSTLTANLSATTGHAVSLAVTVVAALLGFLAGSALARRAQRTRRQLALFGSTAFAVAAGAICACGAVTLLAAYLRTYGSWTGSAVDLTLMVLAFPIFALLGFAVGALVGSIAGAVLSGALRLLTSAPR